MLEAVYIRVVMVCIPWLFAGGIPHRHGRYTSWRAVYVEHWDLLQVLRKTFTH
jgi:hypothetical protein